MLTLLKGDLIEAGDQVYTLLDGEGSSEECVWWTVLPCMVGGVVDDNHVPVRRPERLHEDALGRKGMRCDCRVCSNA